MAPTDVAPCLRQEAHQDAAPQRDREVRDEGMAKIMADPRMKPDANPMPFDGKRLIYGGFVPVLDTAE